MIHCHQEVNTLHRLPQLRVNNKTTSQTSEVYICTGLTYHLLSSTHYSQVLLQFQLTMRSIRFEWSNRQYGRKDKAIDIQWYLRWLQCLPCKESHPRLTDSTDIIRKTT